MSASALDRFDVAALPMFEKQDGAAAGATQTELVSSVKHQATPAPAAPVPGGGALFRPFQETAEVMVARPLVVNAIHSGISV